MRQKSRALIKPYEHKGRGHATNLEEMCLYFYSVLKVRSQDLGAILVRSVPKKHDAS